MTKHPKPPEVLNYAKELIHLLGETKALPVNQIKQVVYLCGIDFAREIYNATVEIEDQGGMMLPDKSRRRTKGGIFFRLVRSKIDTELRREIFPSRLFHNKNKLKLPVGIPLFEWPKRIALIESPQSEQGEIRTMKIVLIGLTQHLFGQGV